MDDERSRQLDEAERRGDLRQQEAGDRYQRARTSASLEGERSALLSFEIQTLQNRIERLERRIAGLEDEVATLRRGQQRESS